MRYRQLGRTRLKVSEIGHGLWGMGGWTGSSPEQNAAALHKAIKKGCNFFDTAFAYGEGRADSLLGGVLSNYNRDDFVVASKIAPKNWKWPADPSDNVDAVYPKSYILESATVIQRLLKVEQIDLLQFHVWDDHWADASGWQEAVDELRTSGTIKAFGLSLNRWEPQNGIKALRTGLIDTVQVIYNIFDQAPEDALFPVCKELNIGVIARVPLDEGSLAGMLNSQTRFPESDWRSKYFGPENLLPTLDRVERLRALVPKKSSLAQMALQFVISNPVVSSTIVGMRTLEHVDENVDASARGPLDSTLLSELKKHRWDREVTPWAN